MNLERISVEPDLQLQYNFVRKAQFPFKTYLGQVVNTILGCMSLLRNSRVDSGSVHNKSSNQALASR